jgi:hypothetical protein
MKVWGERKFCYGAILLLVVLAPAAWGQRMFIPETPMTANGVIGFGYSGGGASSANAGNADDIYVLTDVTVNGFYHDPRFLNFTIAPNFRWSRAGLSDQVMHDGNEGLSASANFLSGTSIPLTVQYNLTRVTTTALSTGPGAVSVAASGLNQSFTLTQAIKRLHWPALTLSFSKGGGSNTTEGTNLETSSHTLAYNANLGYQLLGFRLTAGYRHTNAGLRVPDFLQLGTPTDSNLKQTVENVGVGRTLPLKSDMSASYSHSDSTDTSLSGVNLKYDTANAYFSSQPHRRLSLTASTQYDSNATAQVLTGLVGGTAPTLIPFTLGSSRDLQMSAGAAVAVGRGFSVTGSANHSDSELPFEKVTFDSYGAGINYRRILFRGRFQISYSPQRYTVATNETLVDTSNNVTTLLHSLSGFSNSAAVSYTRAVGRWLATANVTFSRVHVQQSYSVPLSTQSFSANVSMSTRLWHEWNFSGGGYVNDAGYAGINGSFGFTGYGSLGNKTWNITLQDQFSRGYMAAVATGLAPVAEPVVPILKTYYSTSNGLTASGSYNRRRLNVTAAFSRSAADVDTPAIPVTTSNLSFDARATYKFRLIDVRAGYRRWSQSASNNGGLDLRYQSYWIELVRRFHLF